MNATIDDLMVRQVMTATPHQTCGHVKKLLAEHKGSCLPVVDSDGKPVGIISSSDFLDEHADGQPISQFMVEKIYTVPQYADASLAARIMRNHNIHHVVVTHEQRVVGIVSSFDLLKLVESHRFVMKNPPDVSQKSGSKRRREEVIGQ